MSISETIVMVDRQYLGKKTKHELEVLVMQLMDMNDAWRADNERLRTFISDRVADRSTMMKGGYHARRICLEAEKLLGRE